MPKKVTLQIKLFKKSEKDFVNPLVKIPKADPITEFMIDDQLYLVFLINKENEDFFNHDNLYINSLKCNIVGEMKIDKKRAVIIQSGNYLTDNNLNKEINGLIDTLTRRELQVVMLVAEGWANKQIANKLNISRWTVSTHLRRIFAKLGVDNRAAMIYHCAKIIERLKRNYISD